MNYTVIICMIILFYIIYVVYPYFVELYSYVQHESPIVLPSIDDGKPCTKYKNFMEQPVNTAYYQYPRFLNPRDACEDECVEGVWWNGSHNGSSKCCKEACKNVKVFY